MRPQLSALGVGSFVRRAFGIRLGLFHQYSPRPLSVTVIGSASESGELPRISLVTPSFNQVQFLGKAIESVLVQKYPDMEYCIQDAGSTDGSVDLLRAYRGRGLTVHIERDAGQADALNRGFANTTGEIMGYLNSDDLLLPGALQRVVGLFHDHPEVDVVYGNRLIVDEQDCEVGRWILPGHDQELLRYVDYVPQESMFWRRRIWDRAGGKFDEKMQFAMDWELILRFMNAGAVFEHMPELFGVFRVHGAQKSQANFVSRGAMEIEELRSRYGGTSTGWLTRLLRHARYLYLHRLVDAEFQKTLDKVDFI